MYKVIEQRKLITAVVTFDKGRTVMGRSVRVLLGLSNVLFLDLGGSYMGIFSFFILTDLCTDLLYFSMHVIFQYKSFIKIKINEINLPTASHELYI